MFSCEFDYSRTECYCTRNKEVKERQSQVKGNLGQLQRACLECLNLSRGKSDLVRFHLGHRPLVLAEHERCIFLI